MALTFDDAVSWNDTGTNVYYDYVRNNGVLCEVITSYHPESYNFSGLFYSQNMGVWCPAQRVNNVVYYYNPSNGSVSHREYNGSAYTDASGVTVTSQSPSGYLAALAQGKDVGFTLEEFE